MEHQPHPVILIDGVWVFSHFEQRADPGWKERHAVKAHKVRERDPDEPTFSATVYLEEGSATRGWVPGEEWKG